MMLTHAVFSLLVLALGLDVSAASGSAWQGRVTDVPMSGQRTEKKEVQGIGRYGKSQSLADLGRERP